jgi:hypothetical protein
VQDWQTFLPFRLEVLESWRSKTTSCPDGNQIQHHLSPQLVWPKTTLLCMPMDSLCNTDATSPSMPHPNPMHAPFRFGWSLHAPWEPIASYLFYVCIVVWVVESNLLSCSPTSPGTNNWFEILNYISWLRQWKLSLFHCMMEPSFLGSNQYYRFHSGIPAGMWL